MFTVWTPKWIIKGNVENWGIEINIWIFSSGRDLAPEFRIIYDIQIQILLNVLF